MNAHVASAPTDTICFQNFLNMYTTATQTEAAQSNTTVAKPM